MRQDDRGVSLIEIIVAITVLVICVAPLFKSMVLSSNINSKSRQLLAASNAAENVMENLKADGMEQFIEENQSNTTIDEIRYFDENDKAAGYCFSYPDYQMDKQIFQMEVEVKPYENSDTSRDYNKKEVVNINCMNRTTDAVYTQEEQTAEEYFIKAAAEGKVQIGQKEDVLNNLEVYYDYEIFSEDDRQRVEQTVRYCYNGIELGENLTLLYDSNQARGTLYNLYIFFQPEKKNVIAIHNTEDYPLEVYLIKQGDTALKDAVVDLYGTTLLYHLGEEKDADFTKGIRLRTNVDDSTDKMVYSYKTAGVQWNGLHDTELEKYFKRELLDAKEITYRLYQVQIKVMQDRKEITTLTGTVTR